VQLGAKGLALLGYLALEPGPHAREEVAALLWGESPSSAARASLRQALRQLRAAVGPHVRADRFGVELSPAVACDAAEFLRAAADDPERAATFPVPRFLAGFCPRHAPAFDEWAEAMRAHLLHRYRETLQACVRQCVAGSRWRDAATYADRLVECDPLSEEAARLAAEAYHMVGERGEALRRLTGFAQRLGEATGAQPGPALRELAERITANRVSRPEGRVGEEGAIPPMDPPLVGRAAEWQALLSAWRALPTGGTRVVLIEGEAGLGKTRLSRDFVQWIGARGATVLRGSALDPVTGIPYGPIVDVLGYAMEAPGLAGVAPEWLAEAARLHSGVRARFPGLPRASDAAEADRRWRLFEGIAQVLLGLAAERPTAVVVEDLQLADPATCALLGFLVRRLGDAPVLLLLTLTLGEVDRVAPAARLCGALRREPRTSVVTLTPLDEADVAVLVRELGHLDEPHAGRRFAARVHGITDGNPFHVVELFKTLFAEGLLEADPATGRWQATAQAGADPTGTMPLPATVRDAIAARCARLPYELRDLLAAVAVAGTGTRPEVLSRLCGMSRLRVAALADALVDRRLLVAEGGLYACAHPVIVEVVRTQLSAARRREIHRALAIALRELESPELAGEVARHAARAGERGQAHTFALHAADAAIERAAYEEAAAWLDLATRMADTPAETASAERRRRAVLSAAGWVEVPALRRPGTPARGIARQDLDLEVQRS